MNDQQKLETQNNQLSAKLQNRGAAPTTGSFKEQAKVWFDKNKAAIAALMGTEEDAKRLFLAAMNVTSKNSQLLQCSPSSIFQALMQCAELKLYPGPLQEAAIVPFWSSKKKCYEAQFMVMYQGIIKLAMNSRHILSVYANVVRERDFFNYTLGSDAKLDHKPAMSDRGEMIAAYAIAKLSSGGDVFEVMIKEDIMRIKGRSQGKDKEYSPWNTEDFEPWMWRKTAVKQLLKLIPKSVELAEAMDRDYESEDQKKDLLVDLTSGFEMSGAPEETEQ